MVVPPLLWRVRCFTVTVTVIAMPSAVHEEMEQRARKEEQKWKRSEHMGRVLRQEEESSYNQKSQKRHATPRTKETASGGSRLRHHNHSLILRKWFGKRPLYFHGYVPVVAAN